jgi:hypothetical protein
MKHQSQKMILFLCVCAVLCLWRTPAEAARQFTVTQVTTPAEFPLGAAQPVTFTVTNTCNGSNAGETISRVQFNVSGTYSYFPPQTMTIPGWTCTLSRSSGSNYRRITCSANSAAYRIPTSSSQDFTFKIINNANVSTDRNDVLSSVVASFWSGTRTRTVTHNTQGAWTWKALLMTLVPSSTMVGNNCQFTLTMTITNKTSITLNAIVPVPSPRPTANTTSANVNSPSPFPANLNLNAGAQGTITWTYTLTDTGAAGGSVYFTACASTNNSCTTNSGTSRTSPTVKSSLVNINSALVCGFSVVSFTNTPDCLYSGDIATFVMTVSNTTAAPVNNVVPSALVSVVTGSAAIGTLAGPTPASIATINIGASGTFTWTAPVTGNPNDTYAVQGTATANGSLITSAVTSTVRDVDGYIVNVGMTNADSSDAEITWNIENWACSKINQVSIAMPGGWVFDDDGYALVTNVSGVDDDSWTRSPGSTTFTAQAAGDRIPSGGMAGNYALLFSQTPVTAGDYTFDVTITDDLGVVRVKPSVVTVNDFNTSGLNATDIGVWQEDVR